MTTNSPDDVAGQLAALRREHDQLGKQYEEAYSLAEDRRQALAAVLNGPAAMGDAVTALRSAVARVYQHLVDSPLIDGEREGDVLRQMIEPMIADCELEGTADDNA